MKVYQRIWVTAYGKIPVDEEGRSYEIHHIDGDRRNNDLTNLQCVSINEHFEIHLKQGDFLAAAAIARRMALTLDQRLELNKLGGRESVRLGKGIHGLSKERKQEIARNGALSHVGKRWYTDGTRNTRSINSPGLSWVEGRTIKQFNRVPVGSKLGLFWNNGARNVRSETQPGPEWVRGKLLSEEQRQRRVEIGKETSERRWNKREQ